MSSTKVKRKHRNRAQRYTSNVFAMFSQEQIQEFKEAFNVIDQNRDGFVDKDDLLEMLTSLGKNPTDEFLDKMISEAPGPLNFTMFLTLFGEKLNGTDPEDVIRNAFACFDPEQYGVLPEDYLKELMTTMGDRWTEEQVEELFLGAPLKNGFFDYRQFTRALKHGSDRDEDPKDCPNLPPLSPLTPTPGSPTKPTLAHERERKLSESEKPMVESPRSRRKSLTKPPEKALDEEFIMRKFSLAASITSYTKPDNIPTRKLSAPAMPKTGQIQQPRKLSQTNPPNQGELDNPLPGKSGLQALQKDLKPVQRELAKPGQKDLSKPVPKDIKPIQKDLKPIQKDLKPMALKTPPTKDLKPALKPAPKSAMKKS